MQRVGTTWVAVHPPPAIQLGRIVFFLAQEKCRIICDCWQPLQQQLLDSRIAVLAYTSRNSAAFIL